MMSSIRVALQHCVKWSIGLSTVCLNEKNGKNHEKVEMLNARVQKIYAFLTQFFLQYDANDV